MRSDDWMDDEDWLDIENKVQNLIIELAKITYKDVPIIDPRGMSRITRVIAEETFFDKNTVNSSTVKK